MKEFLTIITPTYNRVSNLNKLYETLCIQTNKDFVWLVIDDGSQDDTYKYINTIVNDNKINIKYIRKENGGKHTALNIAFDNLTTELFLVVDSDDRLTTNAVEEIYIYYNKYKNDKIGGFVFLRGYSENESITIKFKQDEFKGNYIKDIINKQPAGDRVEVFYTCLIKENRFPIFENENFIGEGYFWNRISKGFDLVFINKIIYIGEYLDGGLTKSGRKMRINNSMGGMYHALEYINNCYSLKLRIKNMILALVYRRFAAKQEKKPLKIKINILSVMCYIPSIIIYYYWKNKYIK